MSSGKADGGGPHLPPPRKISVYHSGPCSARLGPTQAARLNAHSHSGLSVSLLSTPPDLNGLEFVECSPRHPLELGPAAHGIQINANSIWFAEPRGEATHVAVLGGGLILYYGHIAASGLNRNRPAEITFPSRSLHLRWVGEQREAEK